MKSGVVEVRVGPAHDSSSLRRKVDAFYGCDGYHSFPYLCDLRSLQDPRSEWTRRRAVLDASGKSDSNVTPAILFIASAHASSRSAPSSVPTRTRTRGEEGRGSVRKVRRSTPGGVTVVARVVFAAVGMPEYDDQGRGA